MEVKTYRAKSMQEALTLVRSDMGPEASVLQTRELKAGLWGWLRGGREIEVTASREVHVPSRLPAATTAVTPDCKTDTPCIPPAEEDYRPTLRDDFQDRLDHLQFMVEDLCRTTTSSRVIDLPQSLFGLFTELLDAEMGGRRPRTVDEPVTAALHVQRRRERR